MDVVLVNGLIREGSQIVVCGLGGAIVTTIRSLLTPHPMKARCSPPCSTPLRLFFSSHIESLACLRYLIRQLLLPKGCMLTIPTARISAWLVGEAAIEQI